MNKQELIELYERIVRDVQEADRLPNPDKAWNRRYKDIKQWVATKREELATRELNRNDDEPFLERLLFTPDNGVANAGWGKIKTREEFDGLIDDRDKDNILKALKCVIMEPDAINGNKLFESIESVSIKKGHKDKRRNVIVNRVIGACTEKVSSTASNSNFYNAFDLLVGEGKLIKIDSEDFTTKKAPVIEWYDKNVFLMEKVREIIETERGEKPDPTFSSMLIWYVYEKIIGKNRNTLA